MFQENLLDDSVKKVVRRAVTEVFECGEDGEYVLTVHQRKVAALKYLQEMAATLTLEDAILHKKLLRRRA